MEIQPDHASWSVVATVRASHSLCDLFARHYLASGARHVFLFHDDPEHVSDVQRDGVRNTVCDARWWQRGRPGGLEKRQVHNASMAREWWGTDWLLLHCDLDELLWSKTAISEVLGATPQDVAGVIVRSAEAVYDAPPRDDELFATPYFKVFFNEKGRPRTYRDISQRAYGDLREASKYGFWGHIVGKSFIRANAPIGRMPLHAKKRDQIAGFRMHRVARQLVLRHYDTLSADLWKEKHLRRMNGSVATPMAGRFRGRQQELIAAAASAGDAGLDRLYRRMATLEPDVLAESVAKGFVRIIRPEPHLKEYKADPSAARAQAPACIKPGGSA